MSDGTEKWDEDAEHLYSHAAKIGKRPSHEDEEMFTERVAIMVIDGNLTEYEARRIAFGEIYGE